MQFLNVERVDRISHDVYELFVVRNGLDYRVGNCLSIYGPDGKTSRPYSFASGINDPFLSFIIKHVPGGYVSSYLTSLQQGDRIQIAKPFGWFEPGSSPNGVFISTGTGIAPFISSVRSGLNLPKNMIIGVREYDDLRPYYYALKEKKIDFTVCFSKCINSRQSHACLDPSISTDSYSRVTNYLQKFIVQIDEEQPIYYLCGLDTMIQDVSEILLQNGIGIERIRHECFFTTEG